MHKLPFAVLAITLVFALTTCKNPWINELLKSPSELSSLEVVAYAGETKLQGGAAFEPPFSAAVRDYLVYVPLETSRFTVNAGYDGNGTITWTTDGMDGAVSSNSFTFNFHDIEDTRVLTLSVERENMDIGIYHLAVTRTDNIPPPKIIDVSVTPSVGTYFLRSNVVPTVSVTVEPPTDGGTLKYQWFRNYNDNNVTGSLLVGETGTSYTLEGLELEEALTLYYYVEITKTLDGKTTTLASKTLRLTFINREEVLTTKSAVDNTYWVNVPAGTVPVGSTWQVATGIVDGSRYSLPWNTSGYVMGRFPVTYELWEFVLRSAEAGPYRFASAGNQGARYGGGNDDSTNGNPQPVGTSLHPVTMISWRDAIVWCNALSEMEGREPVYVDSEGKTLQDSRLRLEDLIDPRRTTGKNGYRLPTPAEAEYAARGADPNATEWSYQWPGTNNSAEAGDYVWGSRGPDGTYASGGDLSNVYTGEVGRLKPNTIGLYDMIGMVQEFTYPTSSGSWGLNITNALGQSFRVRPYENSFSFSSSEYNVLTTRNPGSATMTFGLRVMRSLDEGE